MKFIAKKVEDISEKGLTQVMNSQDGFGQLIETAHGLFAIFADHDLPAIPQIPKKE